MVDEPIKNQLFGRSLLGLLLDESKIAELLKKYPPQVVQKGAIVCRQGDPATRLIVLVRGSLRLMVSSGRETTQLNDRLTPYRSLNLFAVLRALHFQYSAKADEESEVIDIPWSEVSSHLDTEPVLKTYLFLMTENKHIQQMRKHIDEIGCSNNFAIHLIGSLIQKQLGPQEWIHGEASIPKFGFFAAEGTIQAYQRTKSGELGSLWLVSPRSWINLSTCAEEKPSNYSYRTISNSSILTIDRDALGLIKKTFPEDYEKYSKWLTTASKIDSSEQSETDLEVDLKELFSFARTSKKRKWSYPWVRQHDMMDCGPACLAMVSKYYDNAIPVQYWRAHVNTNQEGTNMFDLARAAERNGFVATAIWSETLDEIDKTLLPAIVIRRYHYLVLYEITDKEVVVGDPSIGIRKLSHAEFYKGYEKAVLLLKPEEKFYSINVPGTKYAHFLELMKGYVRELSLILFCSTVLVIMSFFPPLLMQIIIDEVLSKKDLRLLLVLLSVAAVVATCQAVVTWLRSYYIAYLTSKFDFRAASAFARKMFSLPYSFFATRHTGDFVHRLSEMERLREFITGSLLTTLLDLSTLGLFGLLLFSYSPTVALATFLLAPILVAIPMFFSKKLSSDFLNNFKLKSEQDALIGDMVRGAGLIKSLSGELAARWRFEESFVASLRSNYSFSITASTLGAFVLWYNQISRFGLMGLGVYLAIRGDLSPGQAISLSLLINNVFDPFLSLANSWTNVQQVKGVVERLNDVFLAESDGALNNRNKKVGLRKDKLRGDIEFQEVWFRYGGDSSDWVLKDVSFKIEAGQKVAIVGPSGSGKSTLAYLISRLYLPNKGQILIDGRDYRDYDLDWLRSQVGLLLQESHLFFGSVAQNISFVDPAPDEQRIINAAKVANAHDFISKKSIGYSYAISHGGLGFSGGEKQRIALARTLYSSPSILVLDEATAALDGIAERKMLESLRDQAKGMTMLSIAHRYSTALMSDFALVLNEGRVVGFGTHDHLSQEGGIYSELFGFNSKKREEAA